MAGNTAKNHSAEPRLKKVLGRWDALAIGVGAMIGFGWVVLTGDWITTAGPIGAALAMLVGGAIMAVVGLTYAELVAAMPKAGGEHNYLLRAMGARWSFAGSWAIVGGYITIVAFEAVALPKSVLYLFPDLSHIKLWEIAGSEVYLTWALVGVAGAVAITWINIRGIKTAGVVQTFVVIFLFVIGAMLLAGAFSGGQSTNMEPFFENGVAGFFGVMIVVPFMFVGFDVIPSQGTYFVNADVGADAAEFSRELPHRAGVVAIPTSVFSSDPDRLRPYLRFAFCKRLGVIDEAARRLSAQRVS